LIILNDFHNINEDFLLFVSLLVSSFNHHAAPKSISPSAQEKKKKVQKDKIIKCLGFTFCVSQSTFVMVRHSGVCL
jgi:amino acid permease